MGAVLPPRYNGKLPGNFDILMEQDNAFINDYVGAFKSMAEYFICWVLSHWSLVDFFFTLIDKFGPIFEMWERAFSITHPDHMKVNHSYRLFIITISTASISLLCSSS